MDFKKFKKINGDYVYQGDTKDYNEDESCQPSSRLLDGSQDHGYYAEYVGRGYIDDMPVIAIYLIDEDDYPEGLPEDEGNYDWDEALYNGRLIIDIDKLDDAEYEMLIVETINN